MLIVKLLSDNMSKGVLSQFSVNLTFKELPVWKDFLSSCTTEMDEKNNSLSACFMVKQSLCGDVSSCLNWSRFKPLSLSLFAEFSRVDLGFVEQTRRHI